MAEKSCGVSLDALLPPDMAERAEAVGVRKAGMDPLEVFLLAVLAGAFIGMAANFSTVTMTGLQASGVGYGVVRLLAGLAFSLGLILVVVAGAELFTGNNLIVMAVASRKVTLGQLLQNWVIVYAGNFAGSVLTAYFILLTGQHTEPGSTGAVGAAAVSIAAGKCSLGWSAAFFRGVYCNVLVCLAVWLCFSARSTTDRILAIIPPITAFVAGSFEHCVANMYFIPMGLFLKQSALVPDGVASQVSWHTFLVHNLVPVTLGNVIGGAVMVGVVYWLIYRRNAAREKVKSDTERPTVKLEQ